MKPTIISSNTNSSNSSNGGINIPINREYTMSGGGGPSGTTQTQYAASPGSYNRSNNQQQPSQYQQQPQTSAQQTGQQFSDFGFDPDIDMDMFPRSRLSRMHHDPFSTFGQNSSQFGFPQFNSLGRRRANDVVDDDDDFFHRMPQEFRQYIPEKFGQRRTPVGGATIPTQGVGPYYQNVSPSPSRVVCDAAIQTEDPSGAGVGAGAGRDQVDHAAPRYQSAPMASPYDQQHQKQMPPFSGRRISPPGTQQQQSYSQYDEQTTPPIQKTYYGAQQQVPQQRTVYSKQQTPPPSTTPQTPGGSFIRTIPIYVEGRNEPLINNREIPAQNSAYQSTSPSPSTTHTYTPPKHQAAPSQQTHRPPPLNTQQQQQHQEQQHQEPIPLPEPPTLSTNQQQQQQQQQQQNLSGSTAGSAPPPQTPHTMDSIQRIQDIQRDVLELMSHVEQFGGCRGDKEYVYLDEMLTRNLLKLDNIDTNGKESIRLARKEAIKCIQASINVLEAKAEENRKRLQQQQQQQQQQHQQQPMTNASPNEGVNQAAHQHSTSGEITTTTMTTTTPGTPTSTTTVTPTSCTTKDSKIKNTKNSSPEIQAPIPLPPPDSMAIPSLNPNNNNSNEAITEATTTEAGDEIIKANQNNDNEQKSEKVEGDMKNIILNDNFQKNESSPSADATSNNPAQVAVTTSSNSSK